MNRPIAIDHAGRTLVGSNRRRPAKPPRPDQMTIEQLRAEAFAIAEEEERMRDQVFKKQPGKRRQKVGQMKRQKALIDEMARRGLLAVHITKEAVQQESLL